MSLLRAIAGTEPTDPRLRIVHATTPAAGAEWSQTCPGQSVWQVLAVTVHFVAAAVAISRQPNLTVTDGTDTAYTFTEGVAVTTGVTTDISYLPNLGDHDAAAVGAFINAPITDVYLLPGWTIGSSTTNLQGADAYSNVRLTVLEVFTGDIEHERQLAQKIIDRIEAVELVLRGGV